MALNLKLNSAATPNLGEITTGKGFQADIGRLWIKTHTQSSNLLMLLLCLNNLYFSIGRYFHTIQTAVFLEPVLTPP